MANKEVVDELLEMSRKMAQRLASLQKNQSAVIERLSGKIADTQQFLGAAGVIVKGH